ncbi:MAG: TIGR02611 family protein [Jatrophihabitantaceae bacterium]
MSQESAAALGRRSLRARVRALPGGWVAWRIAVTLAGAAVIVVGIVLLPLPGPGWLIIFAGLGILASEYAWARRLLHWMRAHVARWTRWAGGQSVLVRTLAGLAGLAVIAGVLYRSWLLFA